MKMGWIIMAFGTFLAGFSNAGQDKVIYSDGLCVDGVEYWQEVTASHIARQPKWNPEIDVTCPISTPAVIKAARAAVSKFYPKGVTRKAVRLYVFKMEGTEHWCFQVLFEPPKPDDKDDLNILVLLDGTVPEVRKR